MSKRPKMLASVIREVIAPVLRACPKDCGIVSLTEVTVSSDFSYATVYVSALKDIDTAIAFLNYHKPKMQSKLHTLYRKQIPELRFTKDVRSDRGHKIDALLENM